MTDADPSCMPLLDEISQSFVRAVESAMGIGKAQEATAALTEVLGRDWRNRLIYDKMADTYQGARIGILVEDMVVYKKVDESTIWSSNIRNKINAIKEIRSVTGAGLTEAKNIVEASETEMQTVKLDETSRQSDPRMWEERIMASIKALRSFGFKVVYA